MVVTTEQPRALRSPGRQGEGDRHRPVHGRRRCSPGSSVAKFRYADHTHARILADRRVQGAGAPRRARGPDARGRARRAVRRHGAGPPAVREGHRALRGRHRRRRRRHDAEIAEQRRRADRGRLRAASAGDRLRGARWPTTRRSSTPTGSRYEGDESLGRDRQHARLLDDRARATPTPPWRRADVVVKGRYVTDSVQGVPIEPRAIIAQWQGDKVTVWTSTQVPYAARAGVAHTLEIPESHVRVDRAAARRRLRREVRLPLRGPRRRARARRRAGP